MFEIELDITKFDALQKIINILENLEFILIKNGCINHSVNTNIITSNLSSIFGEDFNIDIINPKKYLKLFKVMTRKNIRLYDDVDMNRYVITNSEIKLFLPKKQQSSTAVSPISNLKPIGEPISIKDNKKAIKGLIGTNEVKLLVHQNQLKGLLVDETGIYQFPEYASDDIDESNCDALVSYGFLAIDAEEYKLRLGKDSNNKFWLFTEINYEENLNVNILENINKKTIDNILI